MKIIFVCTGNTCRSSMAEAVAKKIVADRGAGDNWNFSSAGLAAITGLPASSQAIEVMREKNIDLSKHVARQLTKEMVRETDIVLTMTRQHKDSIYQAMPEFKDKVFMLKEFALDIRDNSESNIADPFGQAVEVYRKVAEEIVESLEEIIEKIEKNKSN